jgi:hypothetical protein
VAQQGNRRSNSADILPSRHSADKLNAMSVSLTPEQVAELSRQDGLLVLTDTENKRGYVLVPTEAYEQAKSYFDAVIESARLNSSVEGRSPSTPPHWEEAKNERRCGLIDKKYEAGLSPEEALELQALQAELEQFKLKHAPRRSRILELIEESLQRQIEKNGRDK